MARTFLLTLFALSTSLAGCGASDESVQGEPLGGDLAGSYDGEGFTPKYGVALDAGESTAGKAELEIQVGEAAIDCSHHLKSGIGNPSGLFARFYVERAELGSYENTWVEYDRLTANGTRQTFSTAGVVEITAIDDQRVTGTITFEETVGDLPLVLEGTFDVKRCR